jgi:hypothetical protein
MNQLASLFRARGFFLGLFVSTLALGLVLPVSAQTPAEKPALPLKVTFERDTSGKNEAPMVVHLANESKQELTVSAHIELSVVVHNRPKTRDVPAQKVPVAGAMTIENLAPEDKITLSAEGYAPMVVVVPYQK